jgi:hypothetical protein
MASAAKKKSNIPMFVLAAIGLAVYGVGTYVIVEVAGGTGIHSDYSNTPNGVTPGAPDVTK